MASRNYTSPEISKVLADEATIERARSDWSFVIKEIEAAREADRPLDEDFITEVGQKRLEFVQHNEAYSGAHPTEKSSRAIVRSIVNLDILAHSI